MTLATVGENGVWATAVFYASDAFDLYFLSAGHTRHAQNFRYQSHIAAAIQEDYKDWPAIQGIQLEGDVVQLQGLEQETAAALYLAKYPFLAQDAPPIQTALTKVNWYRLRPMRLYFIDNSQGLGHRDDVPL
ncbi:MAG: pyridoxamine 5'-phosphate oxidase family protein [Chloroflexi bacterium]|nr:pyridoxamine 5'-phosphate oxidase family protein [Chloroflexota bacterium]